MPSAQACEPPQVAIHLTVMTRRWPSAPSGSGGQSLDDARVLCLEAIPDALVVAQSHDHSVERGGKLPDFVNRR